MKDPGENGKLLIFSAPSGSGKTSIVRHILNQDLPVKFSISATSRQPRENEKDGVDYYFFSDTEFKKKIANNEFVEWEEVYDGIYYGTLHSELDRIWSGGNHVIFDVDVEGGKSLKFKYGNRALSVFIEPPSIAELKKRLLKRATDGPGDIEKRVAKASEEMKESVYFDRIIINEDLEKACKEATEACREFLNNKIQK